MWTGQGEPKLLAPVDSFLVPFSIVWAGFAFYWEYMAVTKWSRSGAEGFIFPMFGLVFVVMGLYITIGRFPYKEWRRRQTFYALTDRRVLILYRQQVQSLSLHALPALELSVDGATGIGSLRFGQAPFPGPLYANTGLEYLAPKYNVPAFTNVRNARQVYALVDQARLQALVR
jgi:hypothetical protein